MDDNAEPLSPVGDSDSSASAVPDNETPPFIAVTGSRSNPLGDLPDVTTANAAYRVVSVLGQGGMGVIYRGYDLNLDRDVAIKVLRREFANTPRIVQRFLSESLVLSALQHPGIAPIYTTGCYVDGRPFYAMKLIEGETFSHLLKERENPHSFAGLRIFSYVCQTMAYAHAMGIVHLDLKPSNIMIDTFDRVHVIDWGLVRRIGSPDASGEQGHSEQGHSEQGHSEQGHGEQGHRVSQEYSSSTDASDTQSGCVRGTPAYMAPEQARGELLDARTDVFALGAILCEILTGSPIYHGTHPQDVLAHAIRGVTSGAIGELAKKETAQWLVGLVTRCLSATPKDRPHHAGEVAREFTDFQESTSNLAHRDMVRFFELSPDLFCIAGFDGCFRRVNANFPRVTGYTEHELLSQPFLNFVHAEDKQRTIEKMERLTQGLPLERFRNCYLHRDGSILDLEWAAQSVVSEGLIYAVARDVTSKGTERSGQLVGI